MRSNSAAGEGAHQTLIDLPIQLRQQVLEKGDELLPEPICHLRCIDVDGITLSETS